MKKLLLLCCLLVLPVSMSLPDVCMAEAAYQSATSKELLKALSDAKKHFKKEERFEAIRNLLWIFLNEPGGTLQKKAKKLFQRITGDFGVMYIWTEPNGAVVTVNGEKIDGASTPIIYYDVKPGSYDLVVKLKGHKTVKTAATVTGGEYTLSLHELVSTKQRRRK
jgi:hypothetical protein